MECLNFSTWHSCFSLNKNAFCIKSTFGVFLLTAKLMRNITDSIFPIYMINSYPLRSKKLLYFSHVDFISFSSCGWIFLKLFIYKGLQFSHYLQKQKQAGFFSLFLMLWLSGMAVRSA